MCATEVARRTYSHIDSPEDCCVWAERVGEPKIVQTHSTIRPRTLIAILRSLSNGSLKLSQPEVVISCIDALDDAWNALLAA